MKINTNPLRSHSTNVINQPSSPNTNISYNDKVEEANHVVSHVET